MRGGNLVQGFAKETSDQKRVSIEETKNAEMNVERREAVEVTGGRESGIGILEEIVRDSGNETTIGRDKPSSSYRSARKTSGLKLLSLCICVLE